MYIIIGSVVIGFIFTFFTRDNLKKTMAGKRKNSASLNITIPAGTSQNKSVDESELLIETKNED